ncbi:hypothetical protein [Kitasatospora sp. NPDC059571]|uniref:hypothetical protein n=1 Tax=Kitasatospora sp. NPDC059571 TaxID=3346871 RepID=UPI0036CC17E1
MAVFAALLIVAGGLGATVLVQQASEKVAAVKVVQRVAPGQRIPSSAIQEIQVAKDTAVPFVRWDQRGQLASRYFAASEIPAGTLLTGPMLTDKGSVASDQAVVGLSLKAGQFPPGLREGDKVRVWWVGRDAAKNPTGTAAAGTGNDGTELTASATVRQVFKAEAGAVNSNLSLSILVPADKAGQVAQAASAGEVALVLLSADPK